MFKVNKRDTRTRWEICSKSTPGVVLVSLFLTLSIFHTCSDVSIINFEQLNAGWATSM